MWHARGNDTGTTPDPLERQNSYVAPAGNDAGTTRERHGDTGTPGTPGESLGLQNGRDENNLLVCKALRGHTKINNEKTDEKLIPWGLNVFVEDERASERKYVF